MPAKHLRHSTVRFIICSRIREYHTWDNEKKNVIQIYFNSFFVLTLQQIKLYLLT